MFYVCFIISGLPNYVTLMELVPISQYTYGYVFFGMYLMIPDYIQFMLNCSYIKNSEGTFTLSKFLGDNLRFFVLGVMMLCINGYHVNGTLWWINMFIIFIGIFYLNFVVGLKYRTVGAPDLLYSNAPLLTFNAYTFIFVLVIVLVLTLLLSYHSHIKQPRQAVADAVSVDEELPRVFSDTDMNRTPIRDDLSCYKIWWSTVNGNANMKGRNKILKFLFVSMAKQRDTWLG